MSRRTLIIAGMSAAVAFAGGYALLDSMQPVTTGNQISASSTDSTKVVAVHGSALVPLNDGSKDGMLIGPDGTILAGPDGRPPTADGVVSADYPDAEDYGYTGAYAADYTEEREDDDRPDSYDEDHGRHDHDDYDHDDDDDDHEDRYDVRTATTAALATTARSLR